MSDSISDSKSSELFNSTFYSSNSINTLDHARTFRNSLILKEISNQSLNSSIKPSKSFLDENAESAVSQSSLGEGATQNSEVQTVNMTTSPSLSALADILNERSKYADLKTRKAQNIDSSIIEEEEEEEEEEEDAEEQDSSVNYNESVIGSRLGIPDDVNENVAMGSPNLIDIDSSNSVQVASSNLRSFDEPDFLSTPKVKPDFPNPPGKVHIQPTIIEQDNSPPVKLDHKALVQSETKTSAHNIRPLKENSKPSPPSSKLHNPKVRSNKLEARKYTDSSAQRTTSAGSVLEDTSVHKKKKSIFSFLKKKEPKAALKNNSILNEGNRMSSSSTFSMNTPTSSKTPEKLKKKSHSSSSIFNSFLKGKIETSESPRKEPIRHKKRTPKSKDKKKDIELSLDTTSVSSVESPLLRNNLNDTLIKANQITKSVDQRKPTPLNMDLILGGNENKKDNASQKQAKEDNVLNNNSQLPSRDTFLSLEYEAPSPAFSKHDTGEVLFPKFLDSHEVDSIVSLERTRSTKSNKRSSMNSQRRSLTDTLSIKAQSEGMFITEASSVVLSTPDLTKSPASSILKNGRFEYSENFAREYSYEGIANEEHNNLLTISNDNDPSKKGDVFLNSIEQKFDQLVMASDEEKTEVEKGVPKPRKEPVKKAFERHNTSADEDNELMSDIMEFASFINFGDDDLNLDLDLGNTTAPYEIGGSEFLSVKNINSPTAFDTKGNKEPSGTGEEFQLYPSVGQVTTYDNGHHDALLSYEPDDSGLNDNDFGNEDFNKHIEPPVVVTPRNNAYLPEFEPNRPVSMSFKGLKAPGTETSFIDFMTPDSPVKSDVTSLGEMNAKDINGHDVRFSSQIILYDTYGEFEYDRHPEISTCNQLTPQLAQMIKLELNELKSAMEVHDDSRCYTHFY